MVYGTSFGGTIITPAWQYRPKRKSPSGYGGQRHLRYIKKERKALYTELLATGRLNSYLANINEQATTQMLLLIMQMAEREGVPNNSRRRIKCYGYSG